MIELNDLSKEEIYILSCWIVAGVCSRSGNFNEPSKPLDMDRTYDELEYNFGLSHNIGKRLLESAVARLIKKGIIKDITKARSYYLEKKYVSLAINCYDRFIGVMNG